MSSIERAATPACVGIDPVAESSPAWVADLSPVERIEQIGLATVRAATGQVAIVKPQSACFERYGSSGVAALERVIAAARSAELLVLLDVKRGDVGHTAEHYAAACRSIGADWVTASGYMGRSTIHPFLDAGLGVFVLVRTSNADAREVQVEATRSGGTVAEHVAEMVDAIADACRGGRGLASVGAVVAAPSGPEDELEAGRLRELMPSSPFLCPGIGAQGRGTGGLGSLRRSPVGAAAELGVVPTASRSVTRVGETNDEEAWIVAVTERIGAFASEARGAVEQATADK